MPQLPAGSRPVAQITWDSYLGTALRNVGRTPPNRKDMEYGDLSSSDPNSSSGEGSSADYSEGELHEGDRACSILNPHRRRRDNRHGRNKHRRYSSSSGSDLGTRIKPIAPKEYDGLADARAYHQFVKESEAYLRDGKVKGHRRIFLLSYYLTGRAYDFYTQKVSLNEEEWMLRQFYDELFNFCFPVDYMMQLRKSLAHCHQNDKSIAEYTHELHELFNMIGDIPERD